LGLFAKGGFLVHHIQQGAKMRQKSRPQKNPAEQVVKDIRRATRRQFSAEEKIRIVLEGLRGEESIAELCRRHSSERRRFLNANHPPPEKFPVGMALGR
jgi:hypothetical protein